MMQGWQSWLSWRMSVRLGRRRFLLTFPPVGNRWAVISTACLLLPIGYFLSAVPPVMVLRKSGLMTPPVEQCVMMFYAPLVWLELQSPPFREFFEAESRLIEAVLGK